MELNEKHTKKKNKITVIILLIIVIVTLLFLGNKFLVKKIILKQPVLIINLGETKQIKTEVYPKYAIKNLGYKTNMEVRKKEGIDVEKDDIITVNQKGEVTAKNLGSDYVKIYDITSAKYEIIKVYVVPSNIGKYVNYNPDNLYWDDEKIDNKDNVYPNSTNIQNSFNIYDVNNETSAKGKSKNESITCALKQDITKYSGWRIMHEDPKTGQITLIHAGTPECFKNSDEEQQGKEILSVRETENNQSVNRAWYKYGNSKYAKEVHYMGISDVLTLLTMYKDFSYEEAPFSVSYGYYPNGNFPWVASEGQMYQNELINIGSYYWVVNDSLKNPNDNLFLWAPNKSTDENIYPSNSGVRPIITLKENVKLSNDGQNGSKEKPYNLSIE